VSTPIVYQTVQETVVVQEASTELVTIPAVYEWVEGDIEGSSTELEFIPPEYETVTETIKFLKRQDAPLKKPFLMREEMEKPAWSSRRHLLWNALFRLLPNRKRAAL